ncbi:hypothetical protein D9619_008800 [Psilocybe cf. subviscida]|uniref:Uncharacterized protein n=1 Tax=Psilocybe cf. subviscida TaxID=2480587 RepID=A0A8H5F0G0_9AGAR|nr:hypothetical protein D9619_008800 [Psilocybe cf. subviscida]
MILIRLTERLYPVMSASAIPRKGPIPSIRTTLLRAQIWPSALRLYIQTLLKASEASKDGLGEGKDLCIRYAETLVFGAPSLSAHTVRNYQEHGGGIYDGSFVADAQEAADILSRARERLDKCDVKLTAEVFLAEEIAYSAPWVSSIFADHLMLL